MLGFVIICVLSGLDPRRDHINTIFQLCAQYQKGEKQETTSPYAHLHGESLSLYPQHILMDLYNVSFHPGCAPLIFGTVSAFTRRSFIELPVVWLFVCRARPLDAREAGNNCDTQRKAFSKRPVGPRSLLRRSAKSTGVYVFFNG